MVLQNQEANTKLALNEQPVGSTLYDRWAKAFGSQEKPKPPWRFTQSTNCQNGIVFPGVYSTDDETAKFGKPVFKEQDWLRNFDLSEIEGNCRGDGALEAASHEHCVLRGGMQMPDGCWSTLTSWSGAYPAALCVRYAISLRCAEEMEAICGLVAGN